MASILDLLELIRLKVRVYHNARVCGNWQINEHQIGNTCFHMPTQGDCSLHVPEHGDWTLNAGDVVIFPRELVHSLRPAQVQVGEQQHLPIAESQHVAGTSMLCGEIRFQHLGSRYLLDSLPPVLIIAGDKAKHWLTPLSDLILNESLRADGQAESPMINRLCELLVCYVLRCFAENSPQSNSIFALYSDQRLARALSAIHAKPGHPWQLAELASEAAMSRTQFANYFRETCGWTPMQYLTWWRMQLAYAALQQGRMVADVAEEVGYGSEAAFTRAFKLAFAETPGQVRKASTTINKTTA